MCQYTEVPQAWLLNHSILVYFLWKTLLKVSAHLLVYLLSASPTGPQAA